MVSWPRWGELAAALQAGVGGAALVVGEAGSGKSSLLAALLEELRDVQLVWVTGDELGQEFPLLPLVEAAAERGGMISSGCCGGAWMMAPGWLIRWWRRRSG
jgi:predicted ATPase